MEQFNVWYFSYDVISVFSSDDVTEGISCETWCGKLDATVSVVADWPIGTSRSVPLCTAPGWCEEETCRRCLKGRHRVILEMVQPVSVPSFDASSDSGWYSEHRVDTDYVVLINTIDENTTHCLLSHEEMAKFFSIAEKKYGGFLGSFITCVWKMIALVCFMLWWGSRPKPNPEPSHVWIRAA